MFEQLGKVIDWVAERPARIVCTFIIFVVISIVIILITYTDKGSDLKEAIMWMFGLGGLVLTYWYIHPTLEKTNEVLENIKILLEKTFNDEKKNI